MSDEQVELEDDDFLDGCLQSECIDEENGDEE